MRLYRSIQLEGLSEPEARFPSCSAPLEFARDGADLRIDFGGRVSRLTNTSRRIHAFQNLTVLGSVGLWLWVSDQYFLFYDGRTEIKS